MGNLSDKRDITYPESCPSRYILSLLSERWNFIDQSDTMTFDNLYLNQLGHTFYNQYFLNKHDHQHNVLDLICGYLKVMEINQLASTCKDVYHHYFIHSSVEEDRHIVQAEQNANVLYCSSKINLTKKINERLFNLQIVKFAVSTKDQGWVSDCESGSWIQAQFLNDQNFKNYRKQKDKNIFPIAYNYQVPDFVQKQKILSISKIPQNSNLLNIYLRTSGRGWKIACKYVSITYFYSHHLPISEKQATKERTTLRNKRRRTR